MYGHILAVSLPHLILGLLDVRPMTGYDLKKAFDGTVAHFWSADQAQIYRVLGRLETDGMVASTVHPQRGKPDRREYAVTPTGVDELRGWLRSPLEIERAREPFLGRVFFSGRDEDHELVRGLLAERRRAVLQRLRVLEAIAAADGSLAERMRTATLRHGVLHLRAEAAWLDETEQAL